MQRRINRRQFTTLSVTAAAVGLLQACGAGAPAPTPTVAQPTATIVAQPIQAATKAPAAATAAPQGTTGAATPAASQKPAGVAARPTPTSEAASIEFVTDRGEDSHYVVAAKANTAMFTKEYPNVTVKITTSVTTEASRLRLLEHKPAEIGNVAGSSVDIAGAIEAIKAGYIYNLDEAMKQESWDTPGKSWWDTINPLIQPLLEVPGQPGVWSLPNNVTTLNFYYNKTLFDQIGAQPPATWAELEAIAKKFKEASITPFTLDGTAAHGYMSWWFDELVARMLGNDVHRDVLLGKTTMAEHPEFLQAAQIIRGFVDNGYFIDGFAGLDHTGSQMVFYQGQAAMVLVGSWLLGEMQAAIPDDFKQDVFRFPMVEGGKGDPKHIFGTCNTYGIAKESPQPELGVEWARCFNSIAATSQRAKELGHQPAILGAEAPEQTPTLNKIFEDSTTMDIFNNGDLYSQMQEHRTLAYDLTGKLFREEIEPEAFIQEMDKNIQAFYGR